MPTEAVSAVKKLAAAPCPDCDEPNQTWAFGGNLCRTCGGSEALVPGLRKPCPWYNAVANHVKGRGITFNGAKARQKDCREGKDACQGRGWTLMAAGDMGVLVNWQVEQPGMWTVSFQKGRVELFNNAGDLYVDKNEDRTEALAETICQSLGI